MRFDNNYNRVPCRMKNNDQVLLAIKKEFINNELFGIE